MSHYSLCIRAKESETGVTDAGDPSVGIRGQPGKELRQGHRILRHRFASTLKSPRCQRVINFVSIIKVDYCVPTLGRKIATMRNGYPSLCIVSSKLSLDMPKNSF
jgi:hypothetical protein